MQTRAITKLPAKAVVFSLMFGVLFVFFSKALDDFDFWFHMTVGREVILSGQIPDKMFYISGQLGDPEKFYEWGFGTLLYLTHSAFGETGLSVLNTVLATVTVLILILQAGAIKGKWVIPATAIAGLVVAIGMDDRITLRPENLLFVTVAATIAFLELRNRTKNNKWLYPIPVIGFVMSNLHPSAIIVVATVCCYLVQDVSKDRSWRAAQPLTTTAIATSIAAMITPFGIEQFFLPFAVAADEGVTGYVAEYFPVLTTPAAAIFTVIFILGVAAFIPKPKSPNAIANGLLFFMFAILTLRYSRNIGLFAIAAFNPLCHLITTALSGAESKSSRIVAKGVVFLLVTVLITSLAWHRYARKDTGYGIRKGVFPSFAVHVGQQIEVTAIASLFHFGGYLTWITNKPVLIDGRNYSFNSLMRDYNAIFSRSPQWESLLAKHRIDTIFTPTLQPFGGTPVPLLGALYFSQNWKLCAIDEIGLWFARSDKVTRVGLNKELIWKRMNGDLQHRKSLLPPAGPVYQLSRKKAITAVIIPWPRRSDFCWSDQ